MKTLKDFKIGDVVIWNTDTEVTILSLPFEDSNQERTVLVAYRLLDRIDNNYSIFNIFETNIITDWFEEKISTYSCIVCQKTKLIAGTICDDCYYKYSIFTINNLIELGNKCKCDLVTQILPSGCNCGGN